MNTKSCATNSVTAEVGPRSDERRIELLEQQVGLCRKLRRLVDRQHILITRNDPSRLMSLLADRQRLTSELGQVSRQLGRLPDDSTNMNFESATLRARAVSLVGEIRTLFAEMMEADTRDAERLTIRKNNVASAMGSIPRGRAMLSAYGRSTGDESPTSKETDEQG